MTTKLFQTKIVLLLFLLQYSFSFGQYTITNYNIKDGLSNYKVQSIFKDRDGFTWIGTQDGLNRFDGTNFKVFRNTPNNPNSISDGNILAITQDKDGLLWVAIDGGGINIINPLTDQITKLFDGKEFEDNHLKYAKNIHIDTDGIIWIATWGGLIKYDKKSKSYIIFKHSSDKNSICDTDVKSTVEDQDGTMWIATTNGLSMLNKETLEFTNYYKEDKKPSIPENSVRYLFVDSNNLLWIGTKGILTSYNKNTNEYQDYTIDANNPRSNTINKVYEDSQNRLWICTEEGIYVGTSNDKSNKEIQFKNTGITQQDSNSIFEDENGHIWFGTRNEGLNIINTKGHKIHSIYFVNEHPISVQTRSITKGENNSIWFGSYDNGIVNYNITTKRYTRYLNNTILAESKIESIHFDSNKNMWIGTYLKGLYHYDFKENSLKNFHEESVINCIYEHGDKTIWVGTASGLRFYDLDLHKISQTQYTIPKEVLTDYIFFIETDSKQNIWIATMHHGVYKISPGVNSIKKYDYKATAKDRYSFISFYEDADGIYYLGSRNGGLIKIYPDGTITGISTENGINSNTICGIIKDKNKNLWLSTTKGINMILNTTPKTYRSLDQSDGVKSYEFYRNSVYQDESGTIFFGGTEGISYFNPEDIIQEKNNLRTIISGLNILNKPYKTDTIIDFKKEIILDYKQNFLNFQFSSIGFYQSDKYKYKYKLEGLDESWLNATNEKSVSYTNLQPGEYTFKVKSTNHHGVWNANPATLDLIILPPFWRTWWFYTFFTITCIGGVLLVITKREQKLISEKEIAQFKLQALRSQMNPHFIFNSLNSIQYFIIKNENRFALNYLSKFSKLVRKILDNSVTDRISLSEEIIFLKNYIEIESLRFDKEINYTIELSQNLKNESLEIPSMLIQPYVENAIIHGLMNLKKENQIDRKIKIYFSKSIETLKCIITDNGVGRIASQEVNKKVKKKYNSLGLSITKSRLDTLNKSNNTRITVDTEDILSNEGHVCGTKITIFIPLD